MPISKNKVLMQFSCPLDLAAKIEQYSIKNGISKAASVVTLLNQQFRGIETMSEMARALKGLTDEQLAEMMSQSVPEIRKSIEGDGEEDVSAQDM